MNLAVTVLGCDGSYPGPGGAASGYLVRGGGVMIWLDAGPGTLANLQRHMDLADLDAVVVSHEHPDHCSDLDGMALAWRSGPGRAAGPESSRRLDVYAPRGVRSHLYHGEAGDLEWNDVCDGAQVVLGRCRLGFSRTDHGPETLAVRIDLGGSSLGYSADSGPAWSLQALGPDLDLVLCEATFTKDHEGSMRHMSARQAGTTARDARVERLVLTHRWPTVDAAAVAEEASTAFGAAVELAEVDQEYRL